MPVQLTPHKYKVNYGEFYDIGANGNLWVEDCGAKALADRFGTPLFITSESQFRASLDAGGYTESCAARHNAQLLPATVLVSGDRAEIITEREQLKDIADRFRVPPRLLAGSFAPTAVAAG